MFSIFNIPCYDFCSFAIEQPVQNDLHIFKVDVKPAYYSGKKMNMTNSFFLTFAFCLMLLLPIHTSRAQGEFNLTGGTGIPEMVNVGVRLRVDQNQYGLSIGTSPGYKNENISIAGDFYYHFSGRSEHTSLQPWFLKTGLTYMNSEGEWEERMNLLLVPRLGREFNLTSNFGVALEAGIMLRLMDKNQPKKERTDEVSGDLDVIGSGLILPSAGLKLFYRLL